MSSYKYQNCYTPSRHLYYEARNKSSGWRCFVHKCDDQIFHPYGWYATYSSTPWLHNPRLSDGSYYGVVQQVRVPGTFRTRNEAAEAGCKIRELESLAFGGYTQSKSSRFDAVNDFFAATHSWLPRIVNIRVLRTLLKCKGKRTTRDIYIWSSLGFNPNTGDRQSFEEYIREGVSISIL